MSDKVLTIIIPAYNVQKYVEQCLESVVNQSCKRFCAIIVDDGSKDEHTAEICQRYAKEYPELIRYIRQENRGLGGARNRGLREVKTPYVGFLDSDDWLCARYMERVIYEIEKYNDDGIDIIFTLPTVYNNATQQMYDWMDKPLFDQIFSTASRVVDMAIETRIYNMEVNSCRRVYRTAFLQSNSFAFQEKTYWEDVFPHYFLLSKARKCLGIPDVGFFYRTNTMGQITQSNGERRLQMANVFEQSFKYLSEAGVRDAVLASAVKTCISFSSWTLEVIQDQYRAEFVRRIRALFLSLPKDRLKRIARDGEALSREDRWFIASICSKRRNKLLEDYQKLAIARKISNRIRR